MGGRRSPTAKDHEPATLGTVDDSDKILARRREFMRLAMSGAAVVASGGCMPCLSVAPHTELRPGGVFVVYVHDRSCLGCASLVRGDLILAVDDVPVSTPAELEQLVSADAQTHVLTTYLKATREPSSLELRLAPGDEFPFHSVGSAALDRAPSWARRRLWGHASPQLALVRVGDSCSTASISSVAAGYSCCSTGRRLPTGKRGPCVCK